MIQLSDGYSVHFHHQTQDVCGARAGTDCVVSTPEGVAVLGQSFVHPNDNFSKITGRKVSFAHALMELKLDREARRKLWNSLLTQVRRA